MYEVASTYWTTRCWPRQCHVQRPGVLKTTLVSTTVAKLVSAYGSNTKDAIDVPISAGATS